MLTTDDLLALSMLTGSGTRTEYVDRNIDVTIQRAPTDESVKLLKEMEEKILEKVVFRGPFEVNDLKAELVIFLEPVMQDLNAVVAFDLNGRQHRVRTTFKPWQQRSPEWVKMASYQRMQIFWRAIRDDVAAYIAEQILASQAKSFQNDAIYRALDR
ncbi:hypothetical protein [Hyphomicrobium sp.]|uniref:hypothetical protein n=1 Tax=Hyphomicrobium sp. TaxID=82 RepID=UPI001D5F52E7|nr:hypothetical protein [Hyphomicrobium sp.]MBY0561427.1 hypothetical protein [Hyphomicrobium sp.]